ncbi:MAG: zinc-ribbon domain-containing protein [Candidatus Bathyarchaeota archaeon]|nr:zinc-ribbon domain-containing protein [Candidatus Bathyarchaeota archaeon]
MCALFRGQGGSSQQTTESDSWYVTYEIQEAYDAIVNETDDWRDRAAVKSSKSRLSFLTRRTPQNFIIDHAVSPRLYRLKDDQVGTVSFELIEVEDGGTVIKATYQGKAKSLIQNFKAKMPVKILGSNVRVCPSCGKEMEPDFKTCPYCGATLG